MNAWVTKVRGERTSVYRPATFFGLPPSLPLAREAAFLAGLLDFPPMWPSRRHPALRTKEAFQQRWHVEVRVQLGKVNSKSGGRNLNVSRVVRASRAGRTAAPPLFETLEILGREAVLARIATALHALPAC